MIEFIETKDLRDIREEVLEPDRKLRMLPTAQWKTYLPNEIKAFAHFTGRYGLPTIELILYLKDIIDGRSAIEIGAGNGDLGSRLGITMTDSKMQNLKSVRDKYKGMGQRVIEYPDDVEELEALAAVKKYMPAVVVASWITTYSPFPVHYGSSPYGVQEKEILDMVETFIIIGNFDTHGDKPIRKFKHETINARFNLSKAKNQDNNRIFIWDKRK